MELLLNYRVMNITTSFQIKKMCTIKGKLYFVWSIHVYNNGIAKAKISEGGQLIEIDESFDIID